MANLTNWFEEHFEELGFEEILEKRTKSSPDFACLKGGEEVGVELEMKSSNFRRHGHSFEETDFVVCLKEDEELSINVISVSPDEEIETETGVKKEVTPTDGKLPLKVASERKITLPEEVCKKLDVEEGDHVMLEIESDKAVIRSLNKYEVEE